MDPSYAAGIAGVIANALSWKLHSIELMLRREKSAAMRLKRSRHGVLAFFCHFKSLNHVLKKRSKKWFSAIGQKRILWKDLVETWNWRILYIFCIQIYVFITPFVRRSWKNTTRTVPRPHKLQDKNSWGPTEARQTPTELWFLCGWGWPPGTPQTWESTWGTRSPGCKVADGFSTCVKNQLETMQGLTESWVINKRYESSKLHSSLPTTFDCDLLVLHPWGMILAFEGGSFLWPGMTRLSCKKQALDSWRHSTTPTFQKTMGFP